MKPTSSRQRFGITLMVSIVPIWAVALLWIAFISLPADIGGALVLLIVVAVVTLAMIEVGERLARGRR